MKRAKRLDLVFCMVLLFVTTAESLLCMNCATADCKDEEVDCDKLPGEEAPAEDAGKRFIQREGEEGAAWQCFTLKGKAKEGGAELTIKGCTKDGKCTSALLEDEGQTCTPCDGDKCNSGEHLKPTTLSFIFTIVMTCLVISQH